MSENINKKTLDEMIDVAVSNMITESKTHNKLKKLVLECLEEIKIEEKTTLDEMQTQIEKVVKGINSSYEVVKDQMKNLNVCGCKPHHFSIRHMYGETFDVEYFKDNSDRTKKLGLSLDEVKEFLKEKLEGKDNKANYVEKAFNKSAENSQDKEKKGDSEPKRIGEKAKDEVSKKEDQPDQPLKEVDKIKKQSDFPVKGEKVKYTPPKQTQKEKMHVIRM